jgi:hypothetical protein
MQQWTQGLIVSLCVAIKTSNVAAEQFPTEPTLTELGWIASDVEVLPVLTGEPGECLRAPDSESEKYLVEIGRAAFRSPMLLGGQAARRGLSCQSCHINGHDNPAFFIQALSGAPGTADVTSSVFSKAREDNVFNPVTIPSLVGIAGKDAFGTKSPAPSIHVFVKDAVMDEFQGARPPGAVLKGLVAYISHLERASCSTSLALRNVKKDMNDIGRIIDATLSALRRNDLETADFLVVSAQSALGHVNERFSGAELGKQREALRRLSADLAGVRRTFKTNPAAGLEALKPIKSQLSDLTEDLHTHRRRSLYDVGVLRAALEAAEQ